MASVNAQSVEDYADRIVYRYPGGRYEQTSTTWALAFSTGLKTILNTDTTRSYVVPQSGLPARFFKIELQIYAAVSITESAIPVGGSLAPIRFFRVSIPTLNFDGKSQQTEFYTEKTEQFYTSPQLRAVNIGDILLEPIVSYSDLQFTSGVTIPQFSTGAATTSIVSIIQPIVTYYKK